MKTTKYYNLIEEIARDHKEEWRTHCHIDLKTHEIAAIAIELGVEGDFLSQDTLQQLVKSLAVQKNMANEFMEIDLNKYYKSNFEKIVCDEIIYNLPRWDAESAEEEYSPEEPA
jgi:hypothetical protein